MTRRIPAGCRAWMTGVAAAGVVLALLAAVPAGGSAPETLGERVRVTAEGGQYPAWSPDGRWILYFRPESRQDLWVVSADGRERRPVLRTPGRIGRMPRWSPESTRIAVDYRREVGGTWEVRVVPLRGGTPEVLASPGRSPRWSPDGRLIAFLRRNPGERRTELWVAPLSGGEPRRVVSAVDNRDFLWAPDGLAVLYVKGSSLRLREVETGEDRHLVEASNFMGFDRMANFDLARNGDRLAYIHGGSLWTLDRSTGRRDEILRVGRPRGLRFSPDGSRIAFIETKPRNRLIVVPAEGGDPKVLATLDGLPSRIRFEWAPDGERLVHTGTTERRLDLHLVPTGGGEARWISANVGVGQNLRQFSPTGAKVVYTMGKPGAPNQIAVQDLGTGERRLPRLDEDLIKLYPQWSPDGRWIAYFAGPAPYSEGFELWVVPAGGGEAQLLTDGMEAASGDGYGWSPDSRRVVFAAGVDNEIWTVGVADGDRRRLTETGEWASSWKGLPSWSSDGRSVAYFTGAGCLHTVEVTAGSAESREAACGVYYYYDWSPTGDSLVYGGERGLSIVGTGGGTRTSLTGVEGEAPVWSPDGEHIFYIGRRKNIWRVPVAGGEPTQLTSQGRVFMYSVSEDGRRIAYTAVVSDPNLWIVEVGEQ